MTKITQIQAVDTGSGSGWYLLGGAIAVIGGLAFIAKMATAAAAAVAAIVSLVIWLAFGLLALAVLAAVAWVAYRSAAGLPLRPARRQYQLQASRPAPRQLPTREQPALNDGGQGGLSVHLHSADAVREWARQMRGER